jgi:hypothetical protein
MLQFHFWHEFYLLKVDVMRKSLVKLCALKAVRPIILVSAVWYRGQLLKISTSDDLKMKRQLIIHLVI